jgi:hypothetical protein
MILAPEVRGTGEMSSFRAEISQWSQGGFMW